jgi:DNA polymerase-4
MNEGENRTIFHIDVNSAFLSWEAAYRLQHGDTLDLREVPSVVGGDEKSRHGIVLAKSIPAKRFGIHTGEVLWQARRKCPGLIVLPPDYTLYMNCSNAMIDLLKAWTPLVERYSVDECFLDVTRLIRAKGRKPSREESEEAALSLAKEISSAIKSKLGFTVNVGISSCKLLAKMASEFEKPDRVHTLFPREIPEKMWPLPVRELFMVGRSTAPRLYRLNIITIGQLAHTDPEFLTAHFKSFGKTLWQYANGIDSTEVNPHAAVAKGIGNSTTTPFDVDNEKEALLYVLSLVETAASRLRSAGLMARVVAVSIRKTDLTFFSHQRRLPVPSDNTDVLFAAARALLLELWDGSPLRHFGVAFSSLCDDEYCQTTFFDDRLIRKERLDTCIDGLRTLFGNASVVRGSFIGSGIPPLTGGVREDYPNMRSLL